MPTYEYACTKCEQHVEVFQRLSEAPLTTCGACGGTLRKVFHPAGIVFKGSGFYATDSRSKPKASTGDGGKDGAKKDGATSSTPSSDPAPAGSTSTSSGGSTAAPSSGGEKAS